MLWACQISPYTYAHNTLLLICKISANSIFFLLRVWPGARRNPDPNLCVSVCVTYTSYTATTLTWYRLRHHQKITSAEKKKRLPPNNVRWFSKTELHMQRATWIEQATLLMRTHSFVFQNGHFHLDHYAWHIHQFHQMSNVSEWMRPPLAGNNFRRMHKALSSRPIESFLAV